MATNAESLGRFAVEEHNKNENAKLQFVSASIVTQTEVTGIEYDINVEANVGKIKNTYEAKVSETMGYKQLLKFKPKGAPKA